MDGCGIQGPSAKPAFDNPRLQVYRGASVVVSMFLRVNALLD